MWASAADSRCDPREGLEPKINAAITKSATAAPASAATATCTEPDCNLVYNGGPVQLTAHVYIVFWGPKWKSLASEVATENYLVNFYKGPGQTTNGDTWSPTVYQYGDSSGHPTFGTSLLAGDWVDTTDAVPASVAGTDLANEAANAANHFGIPDSTAADNDQVLGSCVTGATAAVLGRCAAAATQEWRRLSNGEYVLKHNGECRTAPSANNGAQLTVATCKDTANQQWALP